MVGGAVVFSRHQILDAAAYFWMNFSYVLHHARHHSGAATASRMQSQSEASCCPAVNETDITFDNADYMRENYHHHT